MTGAGSGRRVAGRVGVHVVAGERAGAQRQHLAVGCLKVVDHDVEVRPAGGTAGPATGAAVVRRPLEGQPRRRRTAETTTKSSER